MNHSLRRYLPWVAVGALFATGVQSCQNQQKMAPPASAKSSPDQPPGAIAAVPAPQAVVTPSKALPKDWKIAEEFDFDWMGNGQPSHFKIEQSAEEQTSRLTITMQRGAGLVVDNDDVWEEFARNFTPDEDFIKKNKNLAPSKYAFSIAPAPGARPLIFLTTPQYASDPETLFMLALDVKGLPTVSFQKTLHITEFRDLDGDGVAEIAGQPCFSQGWGHDFLTYDPFHVYQLRQALAPELKLSLPLTEKYNREHYYGWAGPECSEDLAVVLHPPGDRKPVIVTTKEANKMFPQKK
jgi:hypothetical protein